MTREVFVVTGAGQPSCGHAHPSRREALGCRRRGRSRIERVPVRPPSTAGWGVLMLLALLCGGVLGLLTQL